MNYRARFENESQKKRLRYVQYYLERKMKEISAYRAIQRSTQIEIANRVVEII
jgi:hypothetical protein